METQHQITPNSLIFMNIRSFIRLGIITTLVISLIPACSIFRTKYVTNSKFYQLKRGMSKPDFEDWISRNMGNAVGSTPVKTERITNDGDRYEKLYFSIYNSISIKDNHPTIDHHEVVIFRNDLFFAYIDSFFLNEFNYDNEYQGKNGNQKEKPESTGSGSCFILNKNGLIGTAYHVVEGADEIEIFFRDNTSTKNVKRARISPANDLAILKVDKQFDHYLWIADQNTIDSGDVVFTIGFPNPGEFGLEPKYTEGNISALSGYHEETNQFQVSLPIQAGNSGGPLVNMKGELVGVISASMGDKYYLERYGTIAQNVNYAAKAEFFRSMIDLSHVPKQSVSTRKEAIDMAKRSLCYISMTYNKKKKDREREREKDKAEEKDSDQNKIRPYIP